MWKIFSWLFKKKPKKIKIGIALGSGGAKGFSHLGALKAFEENGVEFDIVAGTSIGSLVGALYCSGYSATDIYKLIENVDVGEIKNLLMVNMDTLGLKRVIERNLKVQNIEELPKPFMVVTTNLETAEEKVFSKGNIASAVCASCSYPPFFKPVEIDGERYIDGAFCNSVPADLVKEMGADFIIGIDLANHDAQPGFLQRIFPTYQGKVEKPWQKGYEFSDIMLHMDLKDYKSISFDKRAEMFDIGYKTAMENMPKILDGIENAKKTRLKGKK